MFTNQIQNFFPSASPAGVDVKADERVRPLAEVEERGRVNGVADAAGLLNPKLNPVADADVVAGVPVGEETIPCYHDCLFTMPVHQNP